MVTAHACARFRERAGWVGPLPAAAGHWRRFLCALLAPGLARALAVAHREHGEAVLVPLGHGLGTAVLVEGWQHTGPAVRTIYAAGWAFGPQHTVTFAPAWWADWSGGHGHG